MSRMPRLLFDRKSRRPLSDRNPLIGTDAGAQNEAPEMRDPVRVMVGDHWVHAGVQPRSLPLNPADALAKLFGPETLDQAIRLPRALERFGHLSGIHPPPEIIQQRPDVIQSEAQGRGERMRPAICAPSLGGGDGLLDIEKQWLGQGLSCRHVPAHFAQKSFRFPRRFAKPCITPRLAQERSHAHRTALIRLCNTSFGGSISLPHLSHTAVMVYLMAMRFVGPRSSGGDPAKKRNNIAD